MGKSRNSDWPAVFFLLLLVGALLTAITPSPAKGQQPPLREGCRAVSKLEYDTAKREYILISKGGRYVQTGPFLASELLVVPRLAVDAANGPVADRGPFCLGCSLPALDAVSHRHCIAMVCLRLRDAVAFAESLKPDKSLSAPAC
jgi:hypothetical protein